MRWRLPTTFQGADERFPWFAQAEAILHVYIVGMKLNRLPDDAIHYLCLMKRMV
jgi:hypothetical protein